ncbi:MAG: hypothetical protein WBG46_03865 [Nonlabens sp.]
MKLNRKYIILAFVAALSSFAIAQDNPEKEEEDRLNGGTITVVKAYDPTISDAFKVNSIPQINDTTKVKKKPVTYRIFSVPVASTYTPITGGLDKLRPRERAKYFDNYARLGLGNYVNILGEFAGNFEIDRNSDFGVFLNHNSSQGGIDEVEAENGFSDTALDLSYGARSREMNWGVTGGGRYRTANWYGDFENTPNPLTEDSDVGLNYINYGLGGRAEFFGKTFEKIEVKFSGISSGEDASEFRIQARPELMFDIMDTDANIAAEVDYLSGSFGTQGIFPVPEDYSYLNTGLNPSINLYGDQYKAELGARLNYIQDLENSEGEFKVYPDINASYILVEDLLVGYTKIGGGLDLNSLAGFADENLFLAPSIFIAPTDRQIDAQLGIRGKLTSQFAYKVYGGYRIEENRNFYITDTGFNPFNTSTEPEAWESGNVFYTRYADLNTATAGAALTFDNGNGLDITLKGAYMSYDVENGDTFENVPSQLPEITADLIAGYQINEKWNAGATLYFVGEREAFRIGSGVETLDGFVDLNLDVTYKINPKLSAFLRGNNLTGGNYEFYSGYPVQSLQVLGGAVYKFDF